MNLITAKFTMWIRFEWSGKFKKKIQDLRHSTKIQRVCGIVVHVSHVASTNWTNLYFVNHCRVKVLSYVCTNVISAVSFDDAMPMRTRMSYFFLPIYKLIRSIAFKCFDVWCFWSVSMMRFAFDTNTTYTFGVFSFEPRRSVGDKCCLPLDAYK